MRNVTLCYLISGNRILLGMKKRGFGSGKWNGYGGKVEEGETIEEALIREVREEAGVEVDARDLEKVGIIDFYFTNAPPGKVWDQQVHVYLARNWSGGARESEEMRPEWFDFDKAPIDGMWDGDKHWFPKILEGRKIKGTITFGEDNSTVLKYNVDIVDNL